MLIVAWYFVILTGVPPYEVPLLVGPYTHREICAQVEQQLSDEYQTERCTIMSTNQDSIYIEPED